MLFKQNLGERISMDETCLSQGELYTVLTNKSAQGKNGGLVGRVKIIHGLNHLNYFVTATMFSTGHQGPIVIMEKTATYIVIGTGGLDGGWWNVDFDFIICGQN